MPTPRSLSIVTCSCGWRLGNFQRASAHEDMEAAEAVLINNEVPRMVRHWTLGHELSVNERAPIWVKAVVAKAAREMREAARAADLIAKRRGPQRVPEGAPSNSKLKIG